MDRNHLFQQLQQQDATVLLDLLERSYDQMTTNQRRYVFGQFVDRIPPAIVNLQSLLVNVQTFQKESLAGRYYAPFMVNSKNFMDIPEETDEWFERLGDFLHSSSLLTQQGEHAGAVACFKILFDLIEQIDSGENIVFADELGSWMIPGDQKSYTADYLTSLVATSTPESFSEHVVPLLKRDSWNSFANQVYSTALKTANAEQIQRIETDIEQQKIRTPPAQTQQRPSSDGKKGTKAKPSKSKQSPNSRTQTKRKG